MSFERHTLLLLPFALLSLGPVACHKDEARTHQTSVSNEPVKVEDETVVAEVEGVAVKAGEIEDRVRPRLARLRQEEYEIRKETLDALIADRLMDAEAKRRGLTRQALLKAEVEDKLQKPSAAEIDSVYEQVKPRLGGRTREQAGPDIERSLLDRKSAARHDEFIQSLRSRTRVSVRLAPPRTEVEVPRSSPIFGSPNASVTIVSFSDFQCPFCHRAQGTIDKILETYGKRVRLVHRDFPLEGHAEATPAAQAARCAGEQNKYWEYHRGLMTEPGDLGSADLAARAKRLGLAESAFSACLASDRYAAEVKADLDAGVRLGVSGTPTYFVNGRMVTGARPFEAFAEIIDAELAATGK
jgi:protein-disulfide isomerase